MNYVNVTWKIALKRENKPKQNFLFREYFVTDGKKLVAAAMFEDLKD